MELGKPGVCNDSEGWWINFRCKERSTGCKAAINLSSLSDQCSLCLESQSHSWKRVRNISEKHTRKKQVAVGKEVGVENCAHGTLEIGQ